MPEPAAATYRPSPRPRRAGSPPRPDQPRLRVVPGVETEIPETEAAEDTLWDGSPQVSDLPGFADAETETAGPGRIRRFWASTEAYWTPPGILTEPAAPLTDLVSYARTAPWTHQQTGIIRRAGIIYGYGIAVPYTTWSRYKEHVVQRPGRLLVHLGLLKLFALTGPGIWLVDHIVYPAAHYAGQIFL